MKRGEDVQDHDDQTSKNSSVIPAKIRVARLYYVIFLIRRLIMILIIVIIPSSSLFVLKISLLLILQILCILYATLIRSFSNKKNQMVEVFNETIVLVLMILLAYFNSEDKWTKLGTHMFIGIILFQAYTLLIVTIIGAIVRFYRFIKRCMTRVRIANFDEDQNEDAPEEEEKQAEGSASMVDHFSLESFVDYPRSHNTVNPSMHTTYQDLEEELKQCKPL